MENKIDPFKTTGLVTYLHCLGILPKPAFYFFTNFDHVISVLLVLCFLVNYFIASYFHKHSRRYFPSKLDRNRTHNTCFNVKLSIKYRRWKK